MANLIRSPKSGNDWSKNELLAYNIAITPVSPDQFFRSGADPSLDHMDPALLTAPPGADDPGLSNVTTEYLGYLDLATSATQESLIDDFSAQTLKLLGFNERHIIISTRYVIPLTICGESNRSAQTDVCLLYRPTLILLVLVQDNTFSNYTDAESQVVAEAIAAFQFNNSKREGKGLPRLNHMTIPCITMSGTRPTFYLVPVTEELSTAVITGQYPATETQVWKCVTVAGDTRRDSEGMGDTAYRKLALRRFLAFKTLAKSRWQKILEGY
ncbi:hypothetical protein HYDPIDRAFT_94729 [Hydnomerulius pinastri MD-312]|uniref:Uncharacterized protein n=1 Tax=Hydnomerulius pinastri MD-312 TaxID=994086 RepID=A0A0C9WCQ2_9AGAM|nr:hypothetical protein HYDPIDRAFT_94729 [Hydnomerulius pinastri MD-312]